MRLVVDTNIFVSAALKTASLLRLEREILSKAAAWFARETNAIPPRGSSS